MEFLRDFLPLIDKYVAAYGVIVIFVVIYLESDTPETVYVEDFAGGRFERAGSIRPYQETFERFNRLALDPGESITKIELAMQEAP